MIKRKNILPQLYDNKSISRNTIHSILAQDDFLMASDLLSTKGALVVLNRLNAGPADSVTHVWVAIEAPHILSIIKPRKQHLTNQKIVLVTVNQWEDSIPSYLIAKLALHTQEVILCSVKPHDVVHGLPFGGCVGSFHQHLLDPVNFQGQIQIKLQLKSMT